MRIEDLVSLANAGFTKEEIIKLTTAEVKEPETVKKAEEPAPITEEPKAVDNKANESNEAIPAALNDAIARMNVAITQMQQQAIANTQQPAKLSTDDILAQIINPPLYQK